MIRINLLPFRAKRKKENIKRQLSIYFLSIVFLLLLCFYLNQMQNQKIAYLQSIRDQKKKELLKYRAINRKIKKLNKKIKECQIRLKIIKQIAKYRLEPVKILDEMVMAIPPDSLWLDSLKLNENSLFISGNAKDTYTVALFMKRLKKMPHIDSVELKVMRLIRLSRYQINVCKFELKCSVFIAGQKVNKSTTPPYGKELVADVE